MLAGGPTSSHQCMMSAWCNMSWFPFTDTVLQHAVVTCHSWGQASAPTVVSQGHCCICSGRSGFRYCRCQYRMDYLSLTRAGHGEVCGRCRSRPQDRLVGIKRCRMRRVMRRCSRYCYDLQHACLAANTAGIPISAHHPSKCSVAATM